VRKDVSDREPLAKDLYVEVSELFGCSVAVV
jgi:hypothetical protein